MLKTMEYTVSRTNSPEDYRQVEEMVHDFFKDMPVVAVFGLENSPPDTQPRIYGPEDFIVKATDSAGKIIGFAVNKTDIQTKPKPPPDRIELREFLHFVKDSANLDQLPDRSIELRVLSVSKEWRQRGVARRLVEGSMKEAKAAGFKAMKICCVSEYTAVLVKKMGWREQYRLAYKDYPGLSGKNLHLKSVPGQDYVYYYVVDL
ncbi:uncharacterized protein LOC124359538 isoform X1 [Homalodisca vitripennis]|uniref:uncharacterized protein LOC124359538 isoform X1 n=2 Tax=Homalodisca vitripennis TaxID=197043 RepID=UPI001EEB573D|nr:uncharacterized protein LOC124359538 isoform X1 [Homalodisca vitripennis]